jgi:outer membrane protein TolC
MIKTGRIMRVIFRILAVSAAFAIGSGLVAQETLTAAQVGPVDSSSALTLDQALSEAVASGDDFALVDRTLGVARLQRSVDVARQGLSLSATGAYSLTDGLGDDKTASGQGVIGKAESASGSSATSTTTGFAQNAQGSLSLSTPQSKLTLSASHTLPPSAATTKPSSSIGLTGSQTIWDGYPGGQSSGTLEKSKLTLQSKESQATQSYSAARVKVKQAYITMLAAQRDLDIKKKVLEKQTNLLKQIQAVYALKQASEVDLKTAQINARSAEIDVATADKTLRLANERLAVILGRPASVRFFVADIPDPSLPSASIDEAIAIGLSKRNDLAQYEISSRSATIDSALAKALGQPGVSLTGGAGVAMSWDSPAVYGQALTVGAKITLPIIDSGSADSQAKTSAAQAALYATQAAQLKKTIASDIRDNYETVKLLAEKVDLAKQSADLADLQFELTKTQNAYGTSTMQDVLTASVTAATAEVAYGTARNSYLLAELALESSMGL